VRAAIFDFDGVLVNSEPLHYEALHEALLPEGIDVGEEEYALFYLAYNDREGARIALERHGIPFDASRVERIALRKAAAFEGLMSRVPFFPGAKELVRALAAEVPLAIASGALRREIETILAGGGLRDAFVAIVGADDVSRGKPDPEPYLTALARLAPRAPGLTAGDCMVFEDSMAGILSARAAGMRVVAVTHSYPAARLSAAHHVVESLAPLRPEGLRALFTPSPA
jgi:HAD superfamily hydrolase (TIGR01509 family)